MASLRVAKTFSSLSLKVRNYIMLMVTIPVIVSNLTNFDEPTFLSQFCLKKLKFVLGNDFFNSPRTNYPE